MNAIEKLDKLEAKVREAASRVAVLEVEQAKATRAHDRALGPLRDYHRAIGAGEIEPDPAREAELEAELERETRHVTRRPVLTGGRVSEFVAVDERVEAQLDGARSALDRAETERDRFMSVHQADLIAEALPVAESAARDLALRLEAADGSAFYAAARQLYRFGVEPTLVPEVPRVDRGEVRALRRFAENGLNRPEDAR